MNNKKEYDVVIVGAGISGAIVANQLAEKEHSDLIVEAGLKKDFSFHAYREYLEIHYKNSIKIPNSP